MPLALRKSNEPVRPPGTLVEILQSNIVGSDAKADKELSDNSSTTVHYSNVLLPNHASKFFFKPHKTGLLGFCDLIFRFSEQTAH